METCSGQHVLGQGFVTKLGRTATPSMMASTEQRGQRLPGQRVRVGLKGQGVREHRHPAGAAAERWQRGADQEGVEHRHPEGSAAERWQEAGTGYC